MKSGVPPPRGENLRDAHVQDRQQEAGAGPGGAWRIEAAEGARQDRPHQGRGRVFDLKAAASATAASAAAAVVAALTC